MNAVGQVVYNATGWEVYKQQKVVIVQEALGSRLTRTCKIGSMFTQSKGVVQRTHEALSRRQWPTRLRVLAGYLTVQGMLC